MISLLQTLSLAFTKALNKISDKLKESTAEITESTQEKFGHYQCNSAMRSAKLLGLNPREVALEIVQHAEPLLDCVEKMEIAGPGFINIWIKPEFLQHYLMQMLKSPRFGIDLPEKVKKVIVEFSSPNVAKEMHVGHLRSTIIGESLARLLEFQGQNVLRLNHIGDWGTAFGMLIAYIKAFFPKVFTLEESADLTQLMGWYKASKSLFDEDPEFKKNSQLEVVRLQSGDPDSLKAWQVICDISRKAYQEIYDLLEVSLEERGESYYNPVLPDLVKELSQKSLIQISDGAKCLFLEGFKNREGEDLPLMVQKSDGGYNYDTTDLAAIRQRILEEKADQIIYVVDAGQSLHFQMIFKAAEKAGYLDPKKVIACHVPFGLVLGGDGKKFKTRSGETEKLIDLLKTAIAKAKELLKERDVDLSEEEIEKSAQVLGINAVKYADLSCLRTQDYTFSYDRMLRFEGNTAAFLMYSYVRVVSIKKKAQVSPSNELTIVLQHPAEISLGVHLARFQEALESTIQDLLPSRLAEYLYLLAEKFNAFFRDCRVLGSEQEAQRLILCDLVGAVLQKGMQLLGLKTVEKM